MHAEAGHDLVEHQCEFALRRDLPQLAHEFDGAQLRMAALHRFDDRRGDFLRIGTDPIEAFRAPIRKHDHVGQ